MWVTFVGIEYWYMEQKKWKTIIVLTILLGSLSLGWDWIWGLFFLFWAVDGIRKNETYIVEPVNRVETPNVFWLVIGTWVALSLYSFSVLFI